MIASHAPAPLRLRRVDVRYGIVKEQWHRSIFRAQTSMHRLFFLFVVLIGAWSGSAMSQSSPFMRTIASHVYVDHDAQTD